MTEYHDFENDENKITTFNETSYFLRSWPVQLPVSVKSFYINEPLKTKRKPFIYQYSIPKNSYLPFDDPLSKGQIHFLLDCFVVSAGPVPLQLGRYHPQSDPEAFVPTDLKDNPSRNSNNEAEFWSKVGVAPHKVSKEVPWREEPRYLFSDEPEDAIARELSDMRLVLERLLDNHEIAEWEQPQELRNILELLPEIKGPSPHYPVGDWKLDNCGICFETRWLHRRLCCNFPACSQCLLRYFIFKVQAGQVKIECCNTPCHSYVHRDEISAKLDVANKERFHKLLVLANQDSNSKTCPRCSQILKISKKPKNINHSFPWVTCKSCHLEWCFNCHAPWHQSLSCKQYRKGDRLLRYWARERNHGQLNAQRCPKCKIYIQRTTGCDHMHCTRCMTDFCYKCGERFHYLKFFGDHYSKLSIFGCKYRFKAEHPLQRKTIRGAIFGGKLIAAPLLGTLAICAGALALGISLFALPVYGSVRLYRHCEDWQMSKGVRRRISSKYLQNVNMQCLHFQEN